MKNTTLHRIALEVVNRELGGHIPQAKRFLGFQAREEEAVGFLQLNLVSLQVGRAVDDPPAILLVWLAHLGWIAEPLWLLAIGLVPMGLVPSHP